MGLWPVSCQSAAHSADEKPHPIKARFLGLKAIVQIPDTYTKLVEQTGRVKSRCVGAPARFTSAINTASKMKLVDTEQLSVGACAKNILRRPAYSAEFAGYITPFKHLSTEQVMEPKNKHKHVLVDDRTYSVMSVRNGGMGRVWLLEQAFDDSFDPIYRRRIAVKTFDFMQDERAIEHELNIWISLEHTSILPLIKIGRLNYRLAAIMPMLNGSLDDLIETRGSLNEQEVTKIISDIVEGLRYAWSAFKILHLDLKPSNVLVERASPIRTKIADWGISRLAAENQMARRLKGSTVSAAIYDQKTAYAAGTPLFMAPERFSGNWSLSPTADIYSLGMMAVQLNTGILPFRFGQIDPAEEIATGSFFENACHMLENRSEGFRRFCLQCIHPIPSARPSTFSDVVTQLNLI